MNYKTILSYKISVIGVPEGDEKDKKGRIIFEEIILNFFQVKKKMETADSISRVNKKKNHSTWQEEKGKSPHVIVKLLQTKGKTIILKETKEGKGHIYTENYW